MNVIFEEYWCEGYCSCNDFFLYERVSCGHVYTTCGCWTPAQNIIFNFEYYSHLSNCWDKLNWWNNKIFFFLITRRKRIYFKREMRLSSISSPPAASFLVGVVVGGLNLNYSGSNKQLISKGYWYFLTFLVMLLSSCTTYS